MDIRKLSRITDSRIFDMSKEEQTDKVKEELYKLVQQFVRKYWRQYYPSYKGEVDDLVSDFYTEFLTPKSREKGKEESLLDKFDPSVTTLPYVTKVAVTRMLIDRARNDKGEKNYTEKYDEETGELSLDYLASHLDEPDIQLEDITFSDDEILEMRDLFDEMSPEKKKEFMKYYQEVKNVLAPNFQALFRDLTGEADPSKSEIVISGTAPNFKATLKEDGKNKSETDIRARNIESAKQKALKKFPGITKIKVA